MTLSFPALGNDHHASERERLAGCHPHEQRQGNERNRHHQHNAPHADPLSASGDLAPRDGLMLSLLFTAAVVAVTVGFLFIVRGLS